MQILKKNWFVFKKDKNLVNFAPALKSLKNLHFNALLLKKAYNVWAKKSTEELCFMTLLSDAKIDEKLTHQSTRKSQNWDVDGILLSKVENVWA